MAIINCLGDLKAQMDPLLLRDAFIDTFSGYNEAAQEYNIVVKGRKGSGKSAIARVLQKRYRDAGELCEIITPTTFSFTQFNKLYDSCRAIPGFPIDHTLREIWSYIIYTSAMKAVLESKKVTSLAKSEDIAAIRKYVQKQGLAGRMTRPDYLAVFDSILATIRGSGYSLKPGPFEAIGSVLNGEIRDSAFDALSRVIDGLGIKLHLFVDETDLEWHEAENRDAVIRLLTEIVEAVYRIYYDERERRLYPENLRVKLFLRDEAYASGQFGNPRVLRGRTAQLNWNRDSLFRMICARIGIATGHRGKDSDFVWERIFPRTLSVDRRYHTFDYLLSYTFHRPRDIILLCQKCINQASFAGRIREAGQRIVGEVSEDDILAILPRTADVGQYCNEFVMMKLWRLR